MNEFFEPDEIDTGILLQFARRGGDSTALAEALGLSGEEVETHLRELVGKGYLERHDNEADTPTYGVGEKGRKYLADRNLA